MKYVDEFRCPQLAKILAAAIHSEVNSNRQYNLMEFCGGHTHAIYRYGVQDLLPLNVHFVHGPGCPVCVLPMGRIDNAIRLLERNDVILCTYGDLLRVPGSNGKSLLKVKTLGADVRMVYSVQDALNIAKNNMHRQIVFFALGFETTTPPTAAAILQAQTQGLTNFSVFCNHVLTPAAIRKVLHASQSDPSHSINIDGFLGPSHVSTVIGTTPYEFVSAEFRRPLVIAGFEPLDVMQSVLMLIRQLNSDLHVVENQYTRVVTREGNRKAQKMVNKVMEMRNSFEWRGLGMVSNSALKIRQEFELFDSESRFDIPHIESNELKGCECPAILRGVKKPHECKLFGRVCTPDNPMGSCMVSSEGACAAYWSYGRFRQAHSRELVT